MDLLTLRSLISGGAGVVSDEEISIPFAVTDDGVTANLEFTVVDGYPVIKEEVDNE